ncbi:MAG: carboxypeptidase-like regulatory domain-containing protein [Terracidiphilus sp.]
MNRAYNADMKFMAAFVTFALATPAMAQIFGSAPPTLPYCERAERIKPNLVLTENLELEGRIRNPNGDPLQGSTVELRLFESENKQTFVNKVTTDDDGYFNLGLVPKGKYRLLASSTRAFKQVDKLECGEGSQCTLPIVLEAERPNSPLAQCPVR